MTHKIAIKLHLLTALPFAVLAPGGQSGNFRIHSRTVMSVVTRTEFFGV